MHSLEGITPLLWRVSSRSHRPWAVRSYRVWLRLCLRCSLPPPRCNKSASTQLLDSRCQSTRTSSAPSGAVTVNTPAPPARPPPPPSPPPPPLPPRDPTPRLPATMARRSWQVASAAAALVGPTRRTTRPAAAGQVGCTPQYSRGAVATQRGPIRSVRKPLLQLGAVASRCGQWRPAASDDGWPATEESEFTTPPPASVGRRPQLRLKRDVSIAYNYGSSVVHPREACDSTRHTFPTRSPTPYPLLAHAEGPFPSSPRPNTSLCWVLFSNAHIRSAAARCVQPRPQ